MTPGKIAQVLRNAAALMEQGWCQFYNATDGKDWVHLYDERACCFCLHGAIWRVIDPTDTDDEKVSDDVNEVLDRVEIITSVDDLIAFNDTPGRTAQEVINLALTVAEQLEAQDAQ